MSLWVAEFRMRAHSYGRKKATAWTPALGMWAPTRERYGLVKAVELHGMHDNCEYRVIRYIRASKRRTR